VENGIDCRLDGMAIGHIDIHCPGPPENALNTKMRQGANVWIGFQRGYEMSPDKTRSAGDEDGRFRHSRTSFRPW
jgi:hypothetical protein